MNSKVQKVETPPPPQPRIWTSLDLIKWTSEFFTRKGIEAARLEAELLLSDALGCPRIQLYVNFEKPVPADPLAKFRECVKRRAETREPIQYILGHTEFVDLKLKVNRDVLIPRPETELLGLWAVEKLKAAAGETLNALDLCTGSGCLALFLSHKEARARIQATDLSAAALAVARQNAETLNLAERVAFAEGDLFAALPAEMKGSFDLIVGNPPYIDPACRAELQPEVRDHEPAQALFAEEKGLGLLFKIIDQSGAWLKPGGWLGLEFGFGQEAELKARAEACAFGTVEIAHDTNKIPRFLQAQKA